MRASFYRLVRKNTQHHLVYGQVPGFQIDALVAPQEAAKYILVSLLNEANIVCCLCKTRDAYA